MITIRPAEARDDDDIWSILEPILRDGETYALPQHWSRAEALGFWRGGAHTVFVAELPADAASAAAPRVVGTYYLQPNQKGGGAHVANCGYATLAQARGRGIARAMCLHSLDVARQQGYRAMQFNFVVATNERRGRVVEEPRLRGRRTRAAGVPPSGARIGRRAGDVPGVVRDRTGKKANGRD